MSTEEPRSREVLEHVLGEVRRTRRVRMVRKFAVLSSLLLGGAWLGFDRMPSPRGGPPVVAGAVQASGPVAVPKLAVVEWNNGSPSLVEYSGEELGRLELSFSLEPVVAFPGEFW